MFTQLFPFSCQVMIFFSEPEIEVDRVSIINECIHGGNQPVPETEGLIYCYYDDDNDDDDDDDDDNGWRPPHGGEQAQRDSAFKLVGIYLTEIQNWGRL